MKRKNRDMLHGPLLGSVIRYTIPIILTSWLQLLFNAADLVIVGQFDGSHSLAAVGATGAITNLIINLFIGLSVGAGVSVAHGLGSNDHQAVHRTIHTAIPAAIVSGIFLTIVGVLCSRTFLLWMDTPESILDAATIYMQVYFGGMVFNMVYNFVASILRAAGDTKSPLIFLAVSGLINVGLNVVFVRVLYMNVAGVALATAISQAISAVLVVITLMRRTDACRLEWKKIRFYKPQLLKMIRIGLPAGVQGSMFSISNVMIQSSINSFGDVVMSGNTAAANIEGFIFTAMNAFHQTAVNFTGQNVGAGQYDRVKRILWTCLGSVALTGAVLGGVAYVFGPQLLGIYITDSAKAVEYGIVRLGYICAMYFICGMMDVSTGALRGMGSSLVPMVISVLGVCGIRLLWIATVFRAYHTTDCLYISYGVSWTITFAAQFVAYWLIYRRHMKKAESR